MVVKENKYSILFYSILSTINSLYTDKKLNKILLIYKEIQRDISGAKSYMTNGLLMKYLRISSYIRKPFLT
jgi:hypothetical protein